MNQVTDEAVEATGGATCYMSRCAGLPSHSKRSTNSMRAQCGNSMHVQAIGAVTLFTVLKLPTLGERIMKPSSLKRTASQEIEVETSFAKVFRSSSRS